MEKIKEIKSRYYITLGLLAFTLIFLSLLLTKTVTFKEYIFYFLLFFPLAILFDKIGDLVHKRDTKIGVFFDNNGIRFNTRFGKELYIPWEKLVIQKRISCSGFFTEFLFKDVNNSIKSDSQIIYWANENSYIELVKKYLPKDHQLYKLVSEYAEKRSLEF